MNHFDLDPYRQCAVCKEDDATSALEKYSVRRYAHADCALGKWGAAFFAKLTPWQCTRFPKLVARKYGVLRELEHRCDEYQP